MRRAPRRAPTRAARRSERSCVTCADDERRVPVGRDARSRRRRPGRRASAPRRRHVAARKAGSPARKRVAVQVAVLARRAARPGARPSARSRGPTRRRRRSRATRFPSQPGPPRRGRRTRARRRLRATDGARSSVRSQRPKASCRPMVSRRTAALMTAPGCDPAADDAATVMQRSPVSAIGWQRGLEALRPETFFCAPHRKRETQCKQPRTF